MSVRPVIALLTDFGTSDHYVGTMKGVILDLAPEAATVDITHAVPPQDIRSAAFCLAAAWRYFPPHSIFVVVVDPGVGTSRPAIAMRVGERVFIGPDNGVFDLVIATATPSEAVALDNPQFARASVSETFEGRDRFAPAAAWVARGTPLAAFGAPVPVAVRLDWPPPRRLEDRLVGEVMYVDRFGNLVTNLERAFAEPIPDGAEVRVAGAGPLRLVRTYGDAPPGAMVALFGSTDRLEIAAVGGSAAAGLQAGRGAEVTVVWRA